MQILKAHNGIALSYRNSNYSYIELIKNAEGYSRLLGAYHPKKVMIFSENRPEWIFAFYGGWMQDATVVPADAMSSAKELNYMMNDCRPEILFYSNNTKAVAQAAIAGLEVPPQIVNFDEISVEPSGDGKAGVEISDYQKTAVIIYTSGTTGNPKGVMLSFQNIMANIISVSEDIKIFDKEETTMILLPLHHIFPLMGSMIAPIFTGGKIAMSPSLATEDILATLQQHKVTIIIGVPRLYALIRKGVMQKVMASSAGRLMFGLAKKLNSRGFSKKVFKAVHQKFGGHVKYMVCGGAPLDVEVAGDYKTLGFEMLEGYGMTEAAPMISFTQPGKWKIGAAGQLMKGVAVEVRNGEIVASGKNIMQGYYNKPEETAEILREGWLYTGDLGNVDKEGYITITGRKKEIIVTSSGKNINPVLIETDLLEKINLLKDVGVILKNDKLHAIIQPDLAKKAELGINELSAYIREEISKGYNAEVAPYKKLSGFTLVNHDLPRTRLGKIQRFKLEAMLSNEEKAESSAPSPEFEEFKILKTYLEEQKSVEVLPDDHLEFDLGLDSLDKVGLQTWLEKSFGVDLKVENLMNFPSVVKLAEYIKEKKSKLQVEAINWSDILKEKVNVRFPKSWALSGLLLKASKYFYKVYFRLAYNGLENIPNTPCIIAPNHQSYFDGFIIASLLKRRILSKTYFYAKEKHIRQRWLKFLAKNNNIIVVDLNKDLRLSIQKMASALQNGRNIIIFPEGTRSLSGEIGDFKETFAILSRELDVPVVPVAIKGAWHAFPPGSHIPRPFKQIVVSFLEPIQPGNKSYRNLTLAVRQKIERKLSA
jgi:long-chain acyl-CoA synthetase